MQTCCYVLERLNMEYQIAVNLGILDVVPPEVKLSWSKGKCYPTNTDWSQFSAGIVRVGGLEKMSAMGRQWLFRDESPQTEESQGGIFSAPELAALFNAQVLPAQLEHSTRRSYWGSGQQVLTWGLAHGIMNKLLPMGLEDIQASSSEEGKGSDGAPNSGHKETK